jgi:hypothetical protein
MSVYSFGDVSAAFNGLTGSFPLAMGAGAAEEGITIEPTNDANVLTVGAGGEPMHSQSMDTSATVTVRLLKTSPVNALLMAAYNAQRVSSGLYGKNSIVVRSVFQGDIVTCRKVAFARVPTLNYAKEGGNNEWVFHAGEMQSILGIGQPEI